MFSAEQSVFMCDAFAKHAAWNKCLGKVSKKFASAVPCKGTTRKIPEQINTLNTSGAPMGTKCQKIVAPILCQNAEHSEQQNSTTMAT